MDLLGDASSCDVSLGITLESAFEDPKARKKARHRQEMVEFRLNKKEKQKRLVAEHHRLEREMKTLVETVRTAAACCSGESVTAMLQELLVEREALRNQNMVLCEEITRYEKFTTAALEASQYPMEREQSNLLPRDEVGWRVGEGDTLFYFHAFTRDEVDAEIRMFESELVNGMSSFRWLGRLSGGTCTTHSWLLRRWTKDLSPMIVTPIGCGLHQRGKRTPTCPKNLTKMRLCTTSQDPKNASAICFKFEDSVETGRRVTKSNCELGYRRRRY
ncbi:hypothetical protein PI124_g13121 [Phytophthora idaei]|nr:hypothetical protein PI125_g7618 [Phytophthora idaei]KAG3158311.1 hypothetical protein PI126_g7930 [Phytophthora idaei]KAG3242026.1 hypothetical protein PI124_g13121 [Phytophthora idaei]